MMMTAGVSSPSAAPVSMTAGSINHGSNTLRPRSNDSVIPSARSSSYLCQQQSSFHQTPQIVNGGTSNGQINPLFELDVRKYLIYKSPGEDGPEIKGGPPDALLVKATEVTKNG